MSWFQQSRIFERFWHIAGSVSISTKVLGIVLSVVIVLSLIVTLHLRSVLLETLTTQLADANITEQQINQIVNRVTGQLVSSTLLTIVLGVAAAIFLTRIITRPIKSLVEATRAVASGDYTRRVPRWANDEVGDLATAFNAMTESLAQADQQRLEQETLRNRYIVGVISAQEEERKRVARELHDSTGQSLTSLLVGLQNLKNTNDQTMIGQRIEELRTVTSATLDEVRILAWQLRPSALDDLGLSSALENYVAEYQKRYNLPVDFIATGLAERLPLEIETSIYRIVQEGLTNIARHAQARHASVIIDRRQNALRIIIEDDGKGFNPETLRENSLGLQGIRERAALFNGTLTIESQAGKGATLFIMLPAPENSL